MSIHGLWWRRRRSLGANLTLCVHCMEIWSVRPRLVTGQWNMRHEFSDHDWYRSRNRLIIYCPAERWHGLVPDVTGFCHQIVISWEYFRGRVDYWSVYLVLFPRESWNWFANKEFTGSKEMLLSRNISWTVLHNLWYNYYYFRINLRDIGPLWSSSMEVKYCCPLKKSDSK